MEEGVSFADAVMELEDYKQKIHTMYGLSSFNNLIKNGRVSKVAGFVAGKLGLCGIGEASPQGEILVQGEKALEFLNHVLTNDYTDLKDGCARYSPMCNENGGTVDDLIVYKKADNDYFVVVNAANTEKDFQWMVNHKIDGVELSNVSAEWGQLALQGPNSEKVLAKVAKPEAIPAGYYTCVFDTEMQGIPCMISRTGYTGEDGFEIYMPADRAVDAWELLMDAGQEYGILPCGLGARDTLRMEAAMPLYGHEMNDEISPKVAGLGFAVKMDKPEFIGKEAIEAATPLKPCALRMFPCATGTLGPIH